MEKKEEKLLKELKTYENKWVAIRNEEEIVASGRDAVEVKEKAEKRGFSDVIFFKVLPFRKGYVPISK